MKVLKILGILLLSIIACIYLGFLFVVPNVIDLNKYIPEIINLVKENTNLDLSINNPKVITSPFLEVGIKTDDINIKLPDNSNLFSAEAFKGKVFLPSLLWLTVKVSCAEVEKPNFNIEIIDSEKFKLAKVYEDIVNNQRAQKLSESKNNVIPAEDTNFDLSFIKIIVPSVKLNNYKAVINDLKANHKLSFEGKQIDLGYFNGKNARLKVDGQLLSDDKKNITIDVDVDTFIPEFNVENDKVDNEAVFEMPFINPVKEYRNYNLKSDVKSKLKIRKAKNSNKIWAKGFLDIEKTTVTLSGIQLPMSYLKILAKGHRTDFDTNLFVTEKEFLKLFGTVSNGKKTYLDINSKSTVVHFSNLLRLTKAYLDTLQIKNELDSISASGYLLSDFRLKTNFSEVESDGKFIIRDGNISDKAIGLLFNNFNANILFDGNTVKIKDMGVLINKQPLNISGQIKSNSFTDVNVFAKRIPISPLYLAFAPKEIKNTYNLNSGFLSINSKVNGRLRDISALLKTELDDLYFCDKDKNFIVTNNKFRIGVTNFSGVISGLITNDNFKITLPSTNSQIVDKLFVAKFDNKNLNVEKSDVLLNSSSKITLNGDILNYLTKPNINFFATGSLSDIDLKKFLGTDIAPYFDSKGSIPLKASFEAKGKKMRVIAQVATTFNSYITPISLERFSGKQMLLQFFAENNGDTLKIYKTGLFLRKRNAQFTDNLRKNFLNSREVIGVRSILTNLSTEPFISLLKISIPRDLTGSICIFDKSKFIFGGNLYGFGKLKAPKINGEFYVRNLTIPEILTTVNDINLKISAKDLKVDVSQAVANSSDFDVNIYSTLTDLSQMKIEKVDVNSNFVDVDKLMKVSDNLFAALPKNSSNQINNNSQNQDIPIEITSGKINFKNIKSGNLTINNTTGDISLLKNIFYINNLRTNTLGGNVKGDISMDLVSSEISAKVIGKNFDMEKLLLDIMDMKDMLSGNLNFLADIKMKGQTQLEQMKSLSGYVDFHINDGQLGPFGKFENFLMAENIRENPFFSSTIGSVITNIVTIDTSHFNSLLGHLTFKDGFADIVPIKSQGNVMSMYIAGKVGLIDNSADMKVRGKLASAFSDSLGPLANINPVNLVKNTPGLNVALAKTFSIFCEAVSQEEMNALPELAQGKSDDYATKFQIVLRGDTRKPLKMIKSFKWLALNSDIESAQGFVDTIPIPLEGEENLSVQELINLRVQQAEEAKNKIQLKETEKNNWKNKIKLFFRKKKV